jgi:alkane 1-monooxygenase
MAISTRLKAYGYLSVFLIPLLIPATILAAQQFGNVNAWMWLPMACLFVLLPSADYLIGRDTINPQTEHSAQLEADRYYRWLTLLCVPVYLASVYFALDFFAVNVNNGALSLIGQIGWILSQGVIGGVVAINVAHELIHKSEALESNAGGVLLASVCYGTFKVEHVRGHHVHVSTPLDASSARFGQNVYGFVAQSVPRNVRAGFALEAKRLEKAGKSAWSWHNESLRWTALSLLFAALGFVIGGGLGVAFFFAQSIVAFLTLEVINYIEHYGLERKQLADGRYERTTHLHSWNSSYLLTNLMLFQLQRHSDHHENPKRRYQALKHYEASPQLPGGYAAMFLLALVPPLWFAVMNPRVKQHLDISSQASGTA